MTTTIDGVPMSAQDNKAVVETLLNAWNDSDFQVIEEELVASDFVNHNPPTVPGIGRDRDGMLAAMRYMRQAFPDGRAESVNRSPLASPAACGVSMYAVHSRSPRLRNGQSRRATGRHSPQGEHLNRRQR